MTGRSLWGNLALLRSWTRVRLLSTLRTPRAAFITFGFPLIFLVLFNYTSGEKQVSTVGGKVDLIQYLAPSLGVYGLAVGCFAVPIFGLANAREQGLLKRVRSTPLSPWVYVASWVAGSALTGLASLALMFVVGVPAFGVHVYPTLLPAALVTAVLGAASLTALGLATSTFVRRTETVPAVANLTLFPVSFLSGVFYPLEGAPAWVTSVAHVFPLSHLVKALGACFSPHTQGSGLAPGHLAVIALWGIGGLIVAVRRFRLEAEPDEPTALAQLGRQRRASQES